MPYSLFCTDVASPSGRMPDFHRVVTVNSDSIRVAINAACKLIRSGGSGAADYRRSAQGAACAAGD